MSLFTRAFLFVAVLIFGFTVDAWADSYAPIGHADGINSSYMSWGWACDQDNFSAVLRIDFYVDGGTYAGSYNESPRV